MFRRVALVVATLLVGGIETSRADETVKSFACTFSEGAAASYDKGAFKSEAASPIRFEIADIALSAQTAAIVSGERRTVVRVFRGVSALNVLEIVAEGYLASGSACATLRCTRPAGRVALSRVVFGEVSGQAAGTFNRARARAAW
jgi:hypothetical protein